MKRTRHVFPNPKIPVSHRSRKGETPEGGRCARKESWRKERVEPRCARAVDQ